MQPYLNPPKKSFKFTIQIPTAVTPCIRFPCLTPIYSSKKVVCESVIPRSYSFKKVVCKLSNFRTYPDLIASKRLSVSLSYPDLIASKRLSVSCPISELVTENVSSQTKASRSLPLACGVTNSIKCYF